MEKVMTQFLCMEIKLEQVPNNSCMKQLKVCGKLENIKILWNWYTGRSESGSKEKLHHVNCSLWFFSKWWKEQKVIYHNSSDKGGDSRVDIARQIPASSMALRATYGKSHKSVLGNSHFFIHRFHRISLEIYIELLFCLHRKPQNWQIYCFPFAG